MTHKLQPAFTLFALGMVALGVYGIATGGFAQEWQPVIAWTAGRIALGYAASLLMLACGATLLAQRTAQWSVRILFVWLMVWQLIKFVVVFSGPGVEVNWESSSETAVLLAGCLVLLAFLGGLDEGGRFGWLAGRRGVRLAELWFGLWLIPLGLSHFFYAKITFNLVPIWMPWRGIWGPITGVAHIAAGVGVLCGARIGALLRVAAWCWAGMISLFTVLIWVPRVAAAPRMSDNWSELCVSLAIAAAAWVMVQPWARRPPGAQNKKTDMSCGFLEIRAKTALKLRIAPMKSLAENENACDRAAGIFPDPD